MTLTLMLQKLINPHWWRFWHTQFFRWEEESESKVKQGRFWYEHLLLVEYKGFQHRQQVEEMIDGFVSNRAIFGVKWRKKQAVWSLDALSWA